MDAGLQEPARQLEGARGGRNCRLIDGRGGGETFPLVTMARRLLDHDPITGVTTWFDYDNDNDTMFLTTEQSAEQVNSVLDSTAAMRADGGYSKRGIKQDWWHYARIPNAVIMEMKLKHGVDMMAPKPDWKSIMKLINREYPALKTTNGTHA